MWVLQVWTKGAMLRVQMVRRLNRFAQWRYVVLALSCGQPETPDPLEDPSPFPVQTPDAQKTLDMEIDEMKFYLFTLLGGALKILAVTRGSNYSLCQGITEVLQAGMFPFASELLDR
ncbi:hypothetical protein CYMTET_4180 [Cymbomonas tetramitiformis]|uniref:Uncharacterized protein n=1 Tax=Cymbomonas tetramitiformis TaxID=36881 RepID=A0AAE0H1P3_9CHLO|nr:hypothetical protein CYMTET_4180 [Cymbomonas tetramitiformis]